MTYEFFQNLQRIGEPGTEDITILIVPQKLRSIYELVFGWRVQTEIPRLRSHLRKQMQLNGQHQGIIATNDEIVDLVHMLGYSRSILEKRRVSVGADEVH